MIASAIEGRIRFRSSKLREVDELARVRRALDEVPGVTRVEDNVRTGSVLVEYIPNKKTEDAVLGIAGYLAEDEEVSPKEITPAAKRAIKTRNMRFAKRGMLISIVATLAFAAADEERAHIYAGLAFLGFNAYHQYGHKSRLLA